VAESWSFPKIFVNTLKEQELDLPLKNRSPLAQNLYYGNYFSEIKYIRDKGVLSEQEIETILINNAYAVTIFYELYPF